MISKTQFIAYLDENFFTDNQNIPDEILTYWEEFKGKEKEKPLFTDNGKLILKYLQENSDTSMFKAKDVGEGLDISSRAVSGAMRKLVADGYVEKIGQNPVMYALTEKGKEIEII